MDAEQEDGQTRLWVWASRIVLLLALLLAAGNVFRNPLFEAPDELLHYQFVRYLLDVGELPVQPQEKRLTQYHQPPLYYVAGALLVAGVDDPATPPLRNPFWLSYRPGEVHQDNKAQFLPQAALLDPWSGTALVVHLLRLGSLLLLAGTLWCLRGIARQLWPGRIRLQTLFLAIAGLNPMLLYIGSAVNNDNLVVFLGALILWLALRLTHRGASTAGTLVLGLLWGAAVLSKITGLLLLVPCGIALLWLAWRDRRWVDRLALGGLIVFLGLVLSGWWFARNVSTYGEPFGIERMLDIWGERVANDWDWPTLMATASYALSTFWGRFAYGQIVLPTPLYAPFVALSLAGIVGLARKGRQVAAAFGAPESGAWLTLMGVAVIFLFAFAYFIWRNPSGANGRYIFPALAAYAAFMSVGVWRLPWQKVLVPMVVLFMIGIAIFSLGWLVPWTYAAPRTWDVGSENSPAGDSGALFWKPGMHLLDATLQGRDVSLDEDPQAALGVCWEAREAPPRNYIFYVHVVDQELNALGKRDTHTGLGNYPTSLWQKGRAFCETYRVPLDTSNLVGPQIADVVVGFYEAEERDPLPAYTAEGAELDYVVVDKIKISRPEASAEERAPISPIAAFDEGLRLQSFAWSATTARPGDTVTLRVRWRAGGPLARSYTVFAHLLNANGALLAQDDHLPLQGRYPTDFWGKGEVIGDEHTFRVPLDAAEGPTSLLLGLYDLSDGQRLPRLDGGDKWPDAVQITGPVITR